MPATTNVRSGQVPDTAVTTPLTCPDDGRGGGAMAIFTCSASIEPSASFGPIAPARMPFWRSPHFPPSNTVFDAVWIVTPSSANVRFGHVPDSEATIPPTDGGGGGPIFTRWASTEPSARLVPTAPARMPSLTSPHAPPSILVVADR